METENSASKKDIADVALAVVVALCFPPAILLPPFNQILNSDND